MGYLELRQSVRLGGGKAEGVAQGNVDRALAQNQRTCGRMPFVLAPEKNDLR